MEINRVRVRQAGAVEMLRELRDVPCLDCGGRFEPYQMDFDHRDPATKLFNLMTGRASLMSDEKLLAEVAKCDIVCANCHRVRTKRLLDERFRSLARTGKGRYIERQRRYWRNHQRLLDELREVPCLDCARRFPTYAMEFDHRDPATKRKAVTRLIGRTSTERLLEEVAKCDIVCANCHRMRTYRRREAALERE